MKNIKNALLIICAITSGHNLCASALACPGGKIDEKGCYCPPGTEVSNGPVYAPTACKPISVKDKLPQTLANEGSTTLISSSEEPAASNHSSSEQTLTGKLPF